MIRCLSYEVYHKKIDMYFFNKVEVIKQYRQCVMNSENVNFFEPVIQKFQRLKVMTIVVSYKKNPKFLYES